MAAIIIGAYVGRAPVPLRIENAGQCSSVRSALLAVYATWSRYWEMSHCRVLHGSFIYMEDASNIE